MPSSLPVPILVVDDEAAVRKALSATLEDEGYVVTGAASGAEALAALRSGRFEIVVTDLLMPGMDGIELLRQGLLIDPNLAGIVLTGHGSVPNAVEAMKSGAIDYVLKPTKLAALRPAMDRALTLRRLRVRNAELAQQLRARTVELEVANKELEAFCYSVSHELRTPLRAVSGFVEILQKHHADAMAPDVRRFLGLIQVGTGEMTQLIHDLLEFSRIARGAPQRQAVDLAALFREVFEQLADTYAGRKIELRVEPLPLVRGDPALLRQAVSNLVSNAIKFTRPRAAGLIEVGVHPESDAGSPVFFVRDNGVGFDMQDAGRLFGVFMRLHHAHEFEGTGVGLANVRRVIERHRGRVWADAVPGAGAIFFFTLPSGPADAENPPPP